RRHRQRLPESHRAGAQRFEQEQQQHGQRDHRPLQQLIQPSAPARACATGIRSLAMTIEWDAGRLDSDLEGAAFETLAVRAGQHRTPEAEHGEALFMTSSYVFRSAADAAARFAGEVPGNVYSRYTNPTVRAFEERIAALEGAEQAVATASGMAAILAMVMGLCSAGDHVLVSRSVFGSTISLFEKYLKRFGIQVDYPPLSDLAAWEAACKPNTRLLFVESPSNPL